MTINDENPYDSHSEPLTHPVVPAEPTDPSEHLYCLAQPHLVGKKSAASDLLKKAEPR